MHLISKVKIENYKSIINGEFQFAPFTPMVGYNNAGKTNILKALDWLVKKSVLPRSDFFDPGNRVVVSAEITGVDEEVLASLGDAHRPKIEPLVVNEKIQIRRIQVGQDAKLKDIPLQVLKTNEAEGSSWDVNPAGIDAAISHLFPEPIFIGAMENATEDVAKFAAGTTIGKLIREIIGPISDTHSGPVTDALAEIASKLSAESKEKDENLVKLDMQIQSELGKF
ncbi:MAG: AAA family ATPase, partial [Pseudomonadota bacterium]